MSKSTEQNRKLIDSESFDSKKEEFRNIGYEHWSTLRKEWLKTNKKTIVQNSNIIAKNIDVDDVIERIYSTNSNGILKEPIPLGQMIDLLVDFWEADGLYD